MGCVFAYTMLITFLGPEYLGRRMDAEGDRDFEKDIGGHDNVDHILHPERYDEKQRVETPPEEPHPPEKIA